MAFNINSKQTKIKVGKHKGKDMFVMKVEHNNTIDAKKITQYASDTYNIPKGVMRASLEALGQATSPLGYSKVTSWKSPDLETLEPRFVPRHNPKPKTCPSPTSSAANSSSRPQKKSKMPSMQRPSGLLAVTGREMR